MVIVLLGERIFYYLFKESILELILCSFVISYVLFFYFYLECRIEFVFLKGIKE